LYSYRKYESIARYYFTVTKHQNERRLSHLHLNRILVLLFLAVFEESPLQLHFEKPPQNPERADYFRAMGREELCIMSVIRA
jgi:hypothetical protein